MPSLDAKVSEAVQHLPRHVNDLLGRDSDLLCKAMHMPTEQQAHSKVDEDLSGRMSQGRQWQGASKCTFCKPGGRCKNVNMGRWSRLKAIPQKPLHLLNFRHAF